MILSDFIAAYIPKEIYNVRGPDYTGGYGWVHQMNMILRELATGGFVSLNQIKEVSVTVTDYYWITIPTDLNSVIDITLPVNTDGTSDPDNCLVNFDWEIVNGKIKLTKPYDGTALEDPTLTLKYMADFTGLTGPSSVIPVEAKFFNFLSAGLIYKSTQKSDPKYNISKQCYADELEKIESNVFTPSLDQLRPQSRSMPGYGSNNTWIKSDFPEYPEVV